ncbi:hypothetical protein AKJ16_DCAP18068 [Drosera capensis]
METSKNITTFKHRGGNSDGPGQRRKLYGLRLVARRQAKGIAQSSKETSRIAVKRIQLLLICCLGRHTTSRLLTEVEYLMLGAKILPRRDLERYVHVFPVPTSENTYMLRLTISVLQ